MILQPFKVRYAKMSTNGQNQPDIYERVHIFILVFWAGRPFSNFYNEFKILGLLYITPDIQKIQRQTQTTTQATETTNFKYSGHSLGCAGCQEERKFACTQ